MSGVNEIRSRFLDYFAKAGHEVVPSSPLVPRNDPTLMFTNAGMVQFKNVFTGLEKRPYARAVTAQKCVRAGGKHNDLDNVGYTARHHTFFEMLGNFSFGDYFKDRAIELAWNLITKEFGLPVDRLLITVFAEDDQAFDLWKKIAGLPESKIVRIAGSDNFWQMGELGPCGPCSEIFYDHGPQIPGGPPGSSEAEGDRFIEIWNLVFMQFEQLPGGKRVDLPKPSIDTGMGIERIAAVLQGTHDNYKIDLFDALIQAVADRTGADPDGPQKASTRVIADHLRSTSFLVSDGVLPSNEGRGYVLRRIMRRAMRHAQLLGAKEPLMHRLVWALVREMLGATEFLGYETESAEGVVAALVKDGKETDSLKAGETGALVLNQTPFYAESGGQVGDTGLMLVDDAREAGARALFGEKYGDEVRVVSMGKGAREHGQNALGWSVELCGGTHVRRTGDIGLISVTSESAVSSGVRRIEALTGRHARKHANDTIALAKTAALELRTSIEDVPARIASLMEERKKLERDLSDARRKLAMGAGASNGSGAGGGVREIGNVKLLARA